MKIFCYLSLFLFLSLPTSFSATSTESAPDWKKSATELKKKEFIMEQAAQDILGNIDVWLNIINEIDGAATTAWAVILGDKLPSQPVGVITVLAGLPQDSSLVDFACPRPFIEGTASDEEIALYYKRSLQTLESFIMVAPEKEHIRKVCLANIKKFFKQ